VACILINNIQQARVQLEKTFEAMGGQSLDKEACDMLNELQAQLSRVLDELSAMYSKSLEPTIQKCCEEVSKLLQSVKGSSQLTPNNQKQVQGEAEKVINPLIDVLNNILFQFANLCDKTVLKRLLKVLIILTNYHILYFTIN
jgi:protein unc-13